MVTLWLRMAPFSKRGAGGSAPSRACISGPEGRLFPRPHPKPVGRLLPRPWSGHGAGSLALGYLPVRVRNHRTEEVLFEEKRAHLAPADDRIALRSIRRLARASSSVSPHRSARPVADVADLDDPTPRWRSSPSPKVVVPVVIDEDADRLVGDPPERRQDPAGPGERELRVDHDDIVAVSSARALANLPLPFSRRRTR